MDSLHSRIGALLTAGLATVSFVHTPVFAQGGNTCSQPTNLVSTGVYPFDNSGATTSGFDGAGSCTGSVSEAHRDLFWTFTVPATGHYLFNTFGSAFDTVMRVYDGGDCAADCLEVDDNSFFLQSEVHLAELQAGQEILIQVGGYTSPYPSQPPEYGVGILTIESFDDRCVGIHLPDYLEESDECGVAIPLGDGLYPELSVSEFDWDFYSLRVAPGDSLVVDVFAQNIGGDLQIALWDAVGKCRTENWNLAVDRSANNNYTGTYDEWVSYTNTSAFAVDLILEVSMPSINGCTPYVLQVVGATGPSHPVTVGSAYCDAVPNSSGEVANLWALGSRTAADNDLRLVAASVPANAFGFFIVSRMSGFVVGPGGSAGNLCLAGSVGRFVGPGQVQSSGLTGEIDLELDLTAIPLPTGTLSVAPGDRLFFQLWMRDAIGGVPTSNFSHGVEVLFQ